MPPAKGPGAEGVLPVATDAGLAGDASGDSCGVLLPGDCVAGEDGPEGLELLPGKGIPEDGDAPVAVGGGTALALGMAVVVGMDIGSVIVLRLPTGYPGQSPQYSLQPDLQEF